MDFLFGMALGLILARSGADTILWKWISTKWKKFRDDAEAKEKNDEVG